MPSLVWTTELMIIACVAGLVLLALGYLLAMVVLGHKNCRAILPTKLTWKSTSLLLKHPTSLSNSLRSLTTT